MELSFRKLYADEIEVRIQKVFEKGVRLLLYKDARVDQKLLDEVVGPMNWQRSHSRDNANCTVSIWDSDKNCWVSKEDTGKESNTEAQKGLASDSFKRACFNWGIGRELYTADRLNLYVGADKLKGLEKNAKGQMACTDVFIVNSIEYEENYIKSVVIDIYKGGQKHDSVRFNRFVNQNSPQSKSTVKASTEPEQIIQKADIKVASSLFKDDEIILFGGFKGRKFGEVKNTAPFAVFLNYIKQNPSLNYDDNRADQLKRFKKLAETIK